MTARVAFTGYPSSESKTEITYTMDGMGSLGFYKGLLHEHRLEGEANEAVPDHPPSDTQGKSDANPEARRVPRIHSMHGEVQQSD